MNKHSILTADNVNIALWEYMPSEFNGKNILLVHGAFSDNNTIGALADYFTQQGYKSWVMEWRDHGSSDKVDEYSLETVANYDYISCLDFLIIEKEIKELNIVAHSAGGMVSTIFLINHPLYHDYIKSLSLFGVQAFGGAKGLRGKVVFGTGYLIARTLGKIPARLAGASGSSEPYHMLKHWYKWNLSGRFLSQAGRDFRALMKNINIPVLSISARGDNMIAPPYGCRLYFEAFGYKDNKLLHFDTQNGALENYNHSRIIKSRNAAKEIWPVVVKWIEKHS